MRLIVKRARPFKCMCCCNLVLVLCRMGKSYLPRVMANPPDYLVDSFVAAVDDMGDLTFVTSLLSSQLLEVGRPPDSGSPRILRIALCVDSSNVCAANVKPQLQDVPGNTKYRGACDRCHWWAYGVTLQEACLQL